MPPDRRPPPEDKPPVEPKPEVKGCECDEAAILAKLIEKIKADEELLAKLKGDPGSADDEHIVGVVKQVIDANPIIVNYQTLDAAGNEVDSERNDQVKLGGTLKVPPSMLRIRDGDERFIIGAALGSPVKVKFNGLKLSGE